MLNNAPDLGVDIARDTRALDLLSPAVASTRLYQALKLRMARFLGRWRTVPDDQWSRAAGFFHDIFGEELKGGSDFYPQIHSMMRSLRETA